MVSDSIKSNIKSLVRETADIVEVINEYVTLKKAGTRFVGLCPFHSEKTPSFSVNPQGQFFYCFGCGESGDVFSFIMKYHHMEFPEALKTLADKYQIALPEKDMSQADKKRLQEREALYTVNEAAVDLYQRCLAGGEGAAAARKYLEQRGVPDAFVEKFRLGFAPSAESVGWTYQTDTLRRRSLSHKVIVKAGLAVEKDRGGFYDRFRSRIMFPLLDMTGRVVAFGGRIIGEGKPKYMNSPESLVFEKNRLLFGLYQHKEAIRKARTALVVEGNFDLLLLAVHGIDNTVAPLGTSLTKHHVKTLRGYCREVVLLFDADAAGLKAAMRSIPFFLAEQLECRVAVLPQGQDPDSLVREEGRSGIIKYVEAARPLAEFFFDTLVERHGLTLSGKGRIIQELKPVLEEAADVSQKALMVAHFSEKLGLDPGQFISGKTKERTVVQTVSAKGGLLDLPRQERQLIEFAILYPEYLKQLQEAGMGKVVKGDISQRIVVLLQRLQEEGSHSPEQLLTLLVEGEERQYVAELLMEGGSAGNEMNNEIVQGMLHELVRWLKTTSDQEEGLRLQEQINEAEQKGDMGLLMELLQKKMIAEKKRTGY